MAQVTGRPPTLPVIPVTRIEPNDGLINANDVWVAAPATDTASNGIVATLAGKHSGSKKKKGRLQGVDCDGRLYVLSIHHTSSHGVASPPLLIRQPVCLPALN